MKPIAIAVDAMGGDHGPSVTIPAALSMLSQCPSLTLILVGQETVLRDALKSHGSYPEDRLRIQHASEVIAMDESPLTALRYKKDSSMRVAVNLVQSGAAEACVSAGNTGALMAIARFILKTIPGIDRPAIVSYFPAMKGKKVRMLDLGANVDSTPEHLLQFAVMGSILASAVDGISNPNIYLLNIGVEEIKGNELVKQTSQRLWAVPSLNYKGYIEGDQVYFSDADVIVCDGFVGNVALKTMEGVAVFIGTLLKQAFHKNIFTKMAGLIVKPILNGLIRSIDPDEYNGASFLGLQGIVIKSHGGAEVSAFARAIRRAMLEVENAIPLKIHDGVSKLLNSDS